MSGWGVCEETALMEAESRLCGGREVKGFRLSTPSHGVQTTH